MSSKSDKLSLERKAILLKIQFYNQELKTHVTSPLDIETIEAYMKEVDVWSNRLDAISVEVHQLNPSDLDDHNKEYLQIKVAFRQTQHAFRSIKAAMPVTPTPTAKPSTTIQNAKLPKLEIPSFNGDYLDWTSFKDSFEAAIHNNATVTKVQKFNYLKSLLKGEAARHIADFALTEANYDLAWKQLHDRYQNKCKLAMAVLDRFFGHAEGPRSAASLKSLVDATQRCIRSMELLGFVKNDALDVVFLHQVLNKLDLNTRSLWQQTRKNHDLPSLDELLDYLECQATALEDEATKMAQEKKYNVNFTESTWKSKPSNNNPRPPQKSKFVRDPRREVSTQPSCKVGCNRAHPLYRCDKFKHMSINERRQVVKNNRLCFICLRDGHQVNECTNTYKCRHCQGLHNTMLHYEADKQIHADENTSKVFHTYGHSSHQNQD